MTQHPASDLALVVSDRLADPETAPAAYQAQDWWRQSLAHGIPGIALLHIELAARGLASWQRACDWLTAAARLPVTSGPSAHPYYGAPALAHALACAAGQLPGTFGCALNALDNQIVVDARRRLAAAGKRIDQKRLPALAEFDALQGLTGYGSYLLRRDRGNDTVRAILEYLVELTDPITIDGIEFPGWWTASGPSGRADKRFPGGHANNGLAHGIGGVLSLLSIATRRGVIVEGHTDAIRLICAWLDRWRADELGGWPYWVTRADFYASQASQQGPLRPSWCYGAAGLARARQLAAIALRDTCGQAMAEDALVRALTDPAQLAATTDNSLCHGFAGLAHIAARCAADARQPARRQLQSLVPVLLEAVHPSDADPDDTASALLIHAGHGPGFLDGVAGIGLAVLAAGTGIQPSSEWDACLLIT